LDKFASRLLRKTVADEFHMWRELAQAGVYDRKMGAKDQEASELHTELSCCKEELTRCQSDLAQATSENQLIHTAKNNLTAELHALQERVHLIEEQNSFLVRSLRQEIDAVNGSLDAVNGSLAASKQSILMKDQSIKSLVDEMKVMKSVVDAQQKEIEMVRAVSQQANMEKKKCLEELMFEKKMTAELDVLRERIVLMQGHNDAMVDAIGEAETKLVAAKLENMEKRKLIKELTFEINGLLAEAEKSLVDSRQTVLMKENCITALMAEEEKCNKELMFDEKMTAELDALRGRMGLMQWSNDALVEFLREAETKLVESKPENMEKKSA
jgi:chromosome segregation ATPase